MVYYVFCYNKEGLVENNSDAIRKAWILVVMRPVGEDEPGDPEDGGEEDGGDGHHEAAHHSYPGWDHSRHLQVQLVLRLHLVHLTSGEELGHSLSLHHLGAGVQGHLQEGNCHGEQHPDVDHLHIRCHWQTLGDSKEP